MFRLHFPHFQISAYLRWFGPVREDSVDIIVSAVSVFRGGGGFFFGVTKKINSGFSRIFSGQPLRVDGTAGAADHQRHKSSSYRPFPFRHGKKTLFRRIVPQFHEIQPKIYAEHQENTSALTTVFCFGCLFLLPNRNDDLPRGMHKKHTHNTNVLSVCCSIRRASAVFHFVNNHFHDGNCSIFDLTEMKRPRTYQNVKSTSGNNFLSTLTRTLKKTIECYVSAHTHTPIASVYSFYSVEGYDERIYYVVESEWRSYHPRIDPAPSRLIRQGGSGIAISSGCAFLYKMWSAAISSERINDWSKT